MLEAAQGGAVLQRGKSYTIVQRTSDGHFEEKNYVMLLYVQEASVLTHRKIGYIYRRCRRQCLCFFSQFLLTGLSQKEFHNLIKTMSI